MHSKQCVVVGCSTSYSDTTTTRHRFPKDENTYNTWVIRSGNKKLSTMSMAEVLKSFVMCDKHFEPNCKSPGFKKLILKSVPTLNIPGNNKIIMIILVYVIKTILTFMCFRNYYN